MNYGFIRCACASPELVVADCARNASQIVMCAKEAARNGASVLVFPELSLTGYTCGDLFFQKTLQENALAALKTVADETKELDLLFFTGLPLALSDGIYNVAAAVHKGRVLAFIPKSFLPNYAEFYERRQFVPFAPGRKTRLIDAGGFSDVPFGTDILLEDARFPEFSVACEICEDVWVANPPSVRHVLNGAGIIANLSAGNEVIGKAEYRRMLIQSQSARLLCAYLYANAGHGESTQDMVFAGHNLIAENGALLAESELFAGGIIYADVDVQRLFQERRRITSFGYSANNGQAVCEYTHIKIGLIADAALHPLRRPVTARPFVPADTESRRKRCAEVVRLQAEGLAKRLRHLDCRTVTLGLSGGLDSTLALLVTATAFDLCSFPRSGIHALTMPCFGTTRRTHKNARALAKETGVTLTEIPISRTVRSHFKDIGQSQVEFDVTYENSQARERTQVLMDYANKTGGIVIGTGDLSELALGWCTYNGDHMSMYGVNSSVPKTLVRYLVEWFAQKNDSAVLRDILATPVSPELLPPADGKIAQKTEALVGPYELHDFFLYYMLRFGFSPAKILFLAKNSALSKSYDEPTIKKWLVVFYRRFFAQQFKRSCMPDGAKVGTVNLSPRGDWRMPSDASARLWLDEAERL